MVSRGILSPTASKAMAASKQPRRSYDTRFEIGNPDYPGIHVHVASNSHFGGVWGHGDLQMTSEVASDLGIELLDLHYLCSCVSLASKCLYELNATTTQEAKHDPLTCVASPQVKTKRDSVSIARSRNLLSIFWPEYRSSNVTVLRRFLLPGKHTLLGHFGWCLKIRCLLWMVRRG